MRAPSPAVPISASEAEIPSAAAARRTFAARAAGLALRYGTAAAKSLRLVASSAALWPLGFWLKFWSHGGEELEVPVAALRFRIRTRGAHRKLTDLYMVRSCVLAEQYTAEPGFRIGPRDSIVDIGAHIGAFTVYAARRAAQGRVFSFEPDEANRRQLEANIGINGVRNVRVSPQAVAGAPGRRPLYATRFNSAENSFYWGTSSFRSVDCVTLEGAFAAAGIDRCDFLKMDCEGAEYEILRAAPLPLLRRISRLSLESHAGSYFGIPDPSATPEALAELLRRAGFAVRLRRENPLHSFIFALRQSPPGDNRR
jgi:FkbM family methyltransferase